MIRAIGGITAGILSVACLGLIVVSMLKQDKKKSG
jgi:hypothetical protein